MIDASKVHDFPSLYLEIAKLKPTDRNHLMRCLRNRQRVLHKEMGLSRRQAERVPHPMSGHGDYM